MGSYRCQCQVGYKGTGLQDECEDANECIPGLNECPHYSHCVNTRGSYECSCDDGFDEISGSGSTLQCDDIDECIITPSAAGTPGRTIDCDPINASCVNTVGSYTCKCNIGYQDGAVTNPNTIHNYTYNDYKETLNNFKVPTGIHCVDVDECATDRIVDFMCCTIICAKKLDYNFPSSFQISQTEIYAIHSQHALIRPAPTHVSVTLVIKILVAVILEQIVKISMNVPLEHHVVAMNCAKTQLVAIVVVVCKDISKMIMTRAVLILMSASKERILVMQNLRF